MAQVKLACRPASARLNTVRCGGGMTPFSLHNVFHGILYPAVDPRNHRSGGVALTTEVSPRPLKRCGNLDGLNNLGLFSP